MREVLTSVNDYDLCVSGIHSGGRSAAAGQGVSSPLSRAQAGRQDPGRHPVRVQLLGQHPEWLAENALRAIELGFPGVDLNFGCPAPRSTRARGAVLLKEPDTIYRIVKAVREAVPAHLPVSAKIRLGYDDKELYLENAQAVHQGGANELAVHARTSAKATRRRPTGSMWTPFAVPCPFPSPPTARSGIMRMPSPAPKSPAAIPDGGSRRHLPAQSGQRDEDRLRPMSWAEVLQLMVSYTEQDLASEKADYYPSRIKQWFSYLKREYPEADRLFGEIRVLKETHPIRDALLQASKTVI